MRSSLHGSGRGAGIWHRCRESAKLWTESTGLEEVAGSSRNRCDVQPECLAIIRGDEDPVSSTKTENVLIASMRRSGGTLLVRLFDGHPECSVFPFEHCYTAKKAVFHWQDNLLFPLISPERKTRACDFKKGFYRKLVKSHGDADPAAFHRELLELAARTRSVRAFYQPSAALYFRHFQADSLRPKLVNHCARLCTLAPWQLRRIFGDYRMLLTVRDPRAVYCSLEHKRNQQYSEKIIPAFCREWGRSVERYHLGNPSVTSFLFEDLAREPEEVMRSVAADLGVAFDGVLLQPTKLGEPARANTSFSRSAGIDPSAIDSWKSTLKERPRREIEERLGPLMRRLGYL